MYQGPGQMSLLMKQYHPGYAWDKVSYSSHNIPFSFPNIVFEGAEYDLIYEQLHDKEFSTMGGKILVQKSSVGDGYLAYFDGLDIRPVAEIVISHCWRVPQFGRADAALQTLIVQVPEAYWWPNHVFFEGQHLLYGPGVSSDGWPGQQLTGWPKEGAESPQEVETRCILF